uniref:Uncharacterized protein n=1 Tax=Palpitomonas bilix TaxID=652834 RepID=A0A7S3LTX6_9EUKA|mmetsp:Transcript_46453/g.119881  ORF Transcript_46453/g.119881 Transcript_46453/m.119881 type:complete len:233 (+) Transcript_46453:47-745(+)
MKSVLAVLAVVAFACTVTVALPATRAGVGSVAAPQPPQWGGADKWTAQVNILQAYNWTFTYYHDDTVNADRYEHKAPQYDEMCAVGKQPYASNTNLDCVVLYATDGWSYINFPSETDACCKCENSFGAVRGDWLQNGGTTYSGQTTLDDTTVDHWVKSGNQVNNYYCTSDDSHLPVRYYEMWKPGEPKEWDFDLTTFSSGSSAFSSSLLSPPPSSSSCSDLCTSSVCEKYRQ